MAVNPLALLGGVGVAAAAVVGGIYVGGTGTSKEGDGSSGQAGTPIVGKPLSSDTDYETKVVSTEETGYKDKYGETYGKYLVGTHEDNNAGGEQAFTKYKGEKTKAKGKFMNLDGDGKTYTELKNVCIAAYKAKTGNSGTIKETSTSTEPAATEFLESNIGLFCSPAEEKIKTVKEAKQTSEGSSTSTTAYGNEEKAKGVLVSVADSSKGNEGFGKEKEKALTDTTKTELFKVQETSVKDWCSKAYKKATEDTTNYPKNKVFLGCSLNGTEPAQTQ